MSDPLCRMSVIVWFKRDAAGVPVTDSCVQSISVCTTPPTVSSGFAVLATPAISKAYFCTSLMRSCTVFTPFTVSVLPVLVVPSPPTIDCATITPPFR